MSSHLIRFHLAARCRRVWSGGLLNGHAIHQELMRLAPDNLGKNPRQRAGVLWRAEENSNGITILAQLNQPPHSDRLADDFATDVDQRELTPMLNALTAGARVRYRIAANATKRHGNSASEEKKGKLANLHGTEAELWWLRKATQAGLHPLEVTSTVLPDILGAPTKDRHDKQRTIRHGVTRFDGIGIVTDPDLLHTTVLDGIGRARTYGCGLLSLGPA
ncbi:type I-E CRISPR-associated protein Cas6/Cse3/CasE [Actinopolyspora mortivallis]|uniref:Type I-E CRISPR-associated protein Cas6/Cse3/CasE n=1 Tax=Actinopolyspora mortivallis TaxID=33906 RepID=A0A2T0H090_ACTMO|nr:type I-E CRISPR-associated protein Cas6/Cse3/CasE [Actinopolyspora mortivallis]PRW64774.1 type I-E CRISPR-associated protein Cas6/Cse3/CasE [Actinopolyspora mortivallis]